MPLNFTLISILNVAFVCMFFSHSAIAAKDQVLIQKIAYSDIGHEDYYFTHLISLALSKTEHQYGKASLVEQSYRNIDKRLRSELHARNIDVIWSPTNEELETEFLPIKISLLKELGNYRLLLIRPEMQPEFSKVKTLNDLRQFKGGMSSQWTDAAIMEANGLPLVKAVGFSKLFKMLAAKRFDYFSRGLYQIQTEVNRYPELQLVIEKDLMLHYPNHVYFFVHKDNKALAERLTAGLELAMKDGSFDTLYNSIPRYRWGLEELNQHRRRVIYLDRTAKDVR
ncbi:MAG: transporter substrate-binding domain-containing protein [Gammaproteobacteria bacterium]|nr:MAG: transporter substrate-binding domain-containing protein [Gammaproteobacteria bacterium]